MPVNNLLTFASGDGALVQSDPAYASDPARLLGFQNGVADPAHVNKAWRQGAFGAATLGQLVTTYAQVNANDDGDTGTFLANIRAGLAAMLAGVYYGQDTSTTVNTLTVTLNPAPPALTSFRSLYVRIANTNTGPVTITVAGIGQKTATRHDGSPLQAGDLVVSRIYHFLYDANLGLFVLAGLAETEVQRIATNVTLYVRTDGSDTNDGTTNTAGGAYKTIAAALSAAARFSNNSTIIVRLGIPGQYAAPNLFPKTGASFQLIGDTGNPANYGIIGAGAPSQGLITAQGCSVSTFGIQVYNTGTSNQGLVALAGGSIQTYSTILSNSNGTGPAHALAYLGGQIIFNAGTTFSSSCAGMVLASNGGAAAFNGAISLVNTPNWTTAGVYATACGSITTISGTSFSGSATGQRYLAELNGVVQSTGGGASFFPGSVAGATTLGGQYA